MLFLEELIAGQIKSGTADDALIRLLRYSRKFSTLKRDDFEVFFLTRLEKKL